MPFPKHRPLASRACELPECSTTERDLMRCTGCMVACYCTAAHQTLDRNRHKKGCNNIKYARRIIEIEEEELRRNIGDMLIFEDDVAYLWGDYMDARYEMVDSLLQEFGVPGGHADAVKLALENLLDMLRLRRSEDMGVRDIVPHLYLRLNRDQEAYDFLKWHATTGRESNYNWDDMDLPYLDVRDADVLEEPLDVWSNEKYLSLSHVAAVTLIKVRILLDLQAAQNTFRVLKGNMPPEIIEMIRGQLIGSVLQSRRGILRRNTQEVSTLIQTMKGQIIALYKSAHTYNPHFWRLMLNNETAPFRGRGGPYLIGTENEAYQTIDYCLTSWVETLGALELMKDLSEKV